MKYSGIFTLLFFLLLCSTVHGQQKLNGTVKDSQGNPLNNVNVYLHESKSGTSTNNEGYYSLLISGSRTTITVEFSRLGYKSRVFYLNVDSLDAPQYRNFDVMMTESATELSEVVVTSGITKEKQKLPYAISSVSRDELFESGAPNLAQTLSRNPGVYFSSFGNGVGKPVLRGLSNTNIVMLNNGIKLENFNFSTSHPFLLDEFATSRVEIIKGPASLQYGSDAVGGVVNAVKERPAPINSIQGEVISQFNTNTNGTMTSIGLKGSGNRTFWGFRAGLKSHEDFTDGNGDLVYNTRFRELNLSANTGIRTDIGVFTLSYQYTEPDYGIQNMGSQNLISNFPDQLEEGRDNQVWYQDLTNHLFTSNSTIYLGSAVMDIDLGFQSNLRKALGGSYDAQNQSFSAPIVASMLMNTVTYNLKYIYPLKSSKILVGTNGAFVNNQADETKPGNPVLDSEIMDASLYTIGDFELSERFNSTVGLRFDYRQMESFPVATQTTDRFKIDNTFSNISGSAGITYSLSSAQFLKANVSSGFRSPSVPELTQNGIHAGRYERGDPKLESQRNYQVDLNYHIHNSWIALDIAPYYNFIDNYIYLVLTNEVAPIGMGNVFQHTQNDTEFFGTDFSIDAHPLNWLGFHATYSFVRADIQDDDNVSNPTFIPQDRFSAEIRLHKNRLWNLDNALFAVQLNHFFEQDEVGQNEAVTDAYSLLNLRAGGDIKLMGQTAELSIIAQNLTNSSYIDHLSVTKQLGLNAIGSNIIVALRIPLNNTF